MKQIIIAIIILVVGCKEQQEPNSKSNKKISDMKKTEKQMFIETNMPYYTEIFRKGNYKTPDEELFRSKVWEYCGVDITKARANSIDFNLSLGNDIPIILDKRFILTFQGDVEPTLADIASGKEKYTSAQSCVDINKIIFYDDLEAIADIINLPENDGDLILATVYFKYEKSSILTTNTIKYLGNIQSDDSSTIANILFYHFNTKPEGKRYRRNFVRRTLHYYKDNSNLSSTLAIFIEKKLKSYPFSQDERDKYTCYFLEECLSVANWGIGSVRSQCYSDTAFSQRIAKENYYGLPLLTALSKNTNLVYTSENINEPESPAPDFGNFPINIDANAMHGVINDSDYYVNVRSEKNATSQIADKIVNGEEFLYWEDNTNEWLKVMTKNVVYGYVHKSRILNAE